MRDSNVAWGQQCSVGAAMFGHRTPPLFTLCVLHSSRVSPPCLQCPLYSPVKKGTARLTGQRVVVPCRRRTVAHLRGHRAESAHHLVEGRGVSRQCKPMKEVVRGNKNKEGRFARTNSLGSEPNANGRGRTTAASSRATRLRGDEMLQRRRLPVRT